MLHPASLLTAGLVMVFAVFLMLLQTLVTQHLSEARSARELAQGGSGTGLHINRLIVRNPELRGKYKWVSSEY